MIKKIRKNNDISNVVNSAVGGKSIIFMTGANSCGAETRLIDLRCRNYCNGNFCRNEIHFAEDTRIQKINSCLCKHWHLLPFQQCFRQILFKIKEVLPSGSIYNNDFARIMHIFCWKIWEAREKKSPLVAVFGKHIDDIFLAGTLILYDCVVNGELIQVAVKYKM